MAQDPVGYGIVLRGDGPVFVKAVDPMGPAAKAGLKVPACLFCCAQFFYKYRKLEMLICTCMLISLCKV